MIVNGTPHLDQSQSQTHVDYDRVAVRLMRLPRLNETNLLYSSATRMGHLRPCAYV